MLTVKCLEIWKGGEIGQSRSIKNAKQARANIKQQIKQYKEEKKQYEQNF